MTLYYGWKKQQEQSWEKSKYGIYQDFSSMLIHIIVFWLLIVLHHQQARLFVQSISSSMRSPPTMKSLSEWPMFFAQARHLHIIINMEWIGYRWKCEPDLNHHPRLDVPELKPNKGRDVVVLVVVGVVIAWEALARKHKEPPSSPLINLAKPFGPKDQIMFAFRQNNFG